MSVHLDADSLAPNILISGDPLRIRYIAETYLESPSCHNQRRNMLGYTGSHNKKSVSVQSVGMGIPSMLIYGTEMIRDYYAKTVIRVGTCGIFSKDLALGDFVVADSAFTDSAALGDQETYHPDTQLLQRAKDLGQKHKLDLRSGPVYTTDTFYDDSSKWKSFAQRGAIAVEMETAALYHLGTEEKICTLSVLLVTDSLLTGDRLDDRDHGVRYDGLVKLALDLL